MRVERSRATGWSSATLLSMTALGCNAIFGTDELQYERTDTTTTATTTATTTTTTTSGGGAGPVADCSDGSLGPAETDVDCGGACPPCVNEKHCGTAADCESHFCEGGFCTPCSIAAHCPSGEECLLPEGLCRGDKPNGYPCNAPNDCASGFCPADDSVCCDTPCALRCEACLRDKTGAPDGICEFVDPSLASDPDGECSAEEPATCGSNGAGCPGDRTACQFWADGTECEPPSCTSGTVRDMRTCDGLGSCRPALENSCDPYVCDATRCRESCSLHTHCVSNHYCAGSTCTPRLGAGQSCAYNEQCLSNQCTQSTCA